MITPTDINRFLSWMDDKGLSQKTRARRRTSIFVLYTYLINTERKLEYNPVTGSQKIQIEQPDYVTYLNMNEQEQLLNCIEYETGLTNRQLMYHENYKKRDLAIVFLFLDTGLRISELNALNVNDVVIYEDILNPEKLVLMGRIHLLDCLICWIFRIIRATLEDIDTLSSQYQSC